MTRLIRIVLLAWFVVGAGSVSARNNMPVFDIRQPTIIAFFPPVTDEQLSKDADMNEVLADFQVYVSRVQEPLRNLGIVFELASAREFCIRRGSAVTKFRPAKVNIGFYFVAPNKKPRVEYGVMTDDDILQVAKEYFGTARK